MSYRWLMFGGSLCCVAGGLLLGCGGSSPPPAEPAAPPVAQNVPAPSPAPSGESPKLKQAIAAIQAQRFADAKTPLLELQQQEPNNAEVAFYLGVTDEGLGDNGQAEPAYRKALALDPHLSDASANLSALLINKGAMDDALQVIEQGLKLSPGHEGLLNNRALVQSQTGDAKGAAETYAELVQKRPDDAETRALYAEALLNAGEPERALNVAKSLLSSTNREVLGLAADLFGRSKAFDSCVEALDKAIAVKDAAELRVRRGLCLHGKNDETKAQADFQTATELDPKNAAAFYYLGRSLAAHGQAKPAKAALERALTLAGDSALGKAAKTALGELK